MKANIRSSSFSTTISVTLDTIEKQQLFNNDPFIYAILLHKQNMGDESASVNIPVNFACIDCSSLSIEQHTLSTRSQSRDGEYLEIEITSDENLIPLAGNIFINLIIYCQSI